MDCIETSELVQAIEAHIRSTLTPKRCAHCESTAHTARALARRLGQEECVCYLAGLAHDMCREMSIEAQEALVAQQGVALEFLKDRDSLNALFSDPDFRGKMIHGPAAACALYRDFGVRDKILLESVALHSIADTQMSACAKIVYIADKLEPRRSRPADADVRLASLDLDRLFAYTVDCVIAWFANSGKTLAPFTKNLYHRILAKCSM